MVRIKDVAEYVGVSTATVSNVINGKDQRVSPAVRDKIRRALDDMGYVKNRSAMMLAQTSSDMIGVIVPSKEDGGVTIEDPYYAALVGNLDRQIREKNCNMYMIAQQPLQEIIRLSIAWNLKGIIVCNMPTNELLELSEKYSRPIVSIDSYLDKKDSFINISMDDFGGGYKTGKYLISKGHKKIIMVADNDYSVDHNRWLGLCEAFKESQIMLSDDDHFIFSPIESIRTLQLEQIFPKLKNYSAVFAASDLYALEISSFLQSKGVSVPEEISIVGFDNLIYAKLARPKLTTINQNIPQKAKTAVEALLMLCKQRVLGDEFRHEEKIFENEIKLDVELVERDSVARV